MESYQIDIQGTVQGVGFPPFVYALAMRFGVYREVWNDSKGVSIRINTTRELLKDFVDQLESRKPPLACINAINFYTIEPQSYAQFSIIQSQMQHDTFVLMPPDVAICDACEAELCTPSNRRYHAQPIGCFECGATLELRDKCQALGVSQSQIIDRVVQIIQEGKIVAIKGVGGYHLICDASNYKAVQTLRKRKNRPHKPLVIMVRDTQMAKNLLKYHPKKKNYFYPKSVLLCCSKNLTLSTLVAPDVDTIGIFFPYTPLHLLLLKALNRPIVATNANVSDEPLARNFEEVMRLAHVWDYCLDHDREIVNGCDDSVVMIVQDSVLFVRRTRGYAPQAITLPFRLSQKVLALGANQKSTISIVFENKAILSSHTGDLHTIDSIAYYRQHIEHLRQIYNFQEDIVVHDKHPLYESTQYAQTLSTIQHHVAHIQAVRLEHGIRDKVLGIAFDGTRYGDDGNMWGGEFIVCDDNSDERVAHLDYFKLLGGDKAIKEPRRVALSLLFECYGAKVLDTDNPTTHAFSSPELRLYYRMWYKGLNAPLTSSIGRLFDGVASLSGIVQTLSYEGQSGVFMEYYCYPTIQSCYLWNLNNGKIDIKPMMKMMLVQSDARVMISKFFNTLVNIVEQIAMCYPYSVILGSGVFQNRVLVELLLRKIGKRVSLPQKPPPPNDGAIALGQIMQGYRA